jgi:hypothetical protein
MNNTQEHVAGSSPAPCWAAINPSGPLPAPVDAGPATFAPGWHCPHCNTDIPGGQYHDCKEDPPPADDAARKEMIAAVHRAGERMAIAESREIAALREQLDEARAELAVLKGRKVTLPAHREVTLSMFPAGRDVTRAYNEAITDCADAIRAAGVEVEQ